MTQITNSFVRERIYGPAAIVCYLKVFSDYIPDDNDEIDEFRSLLLKSLLCDAEVQKNEHGLQFRLGCGLVISTYGSENVTVQGKLDSSVGQIILEIFHKYLPPHTRWCVEMRSVRTAQKKSRNEANFSRQLLRKHLLAFSKMLRG